ncbi:MAG TPA: SRPBCC family protein [Acidimicrobiia bacterium]|nr:SRPBCC family protein [Acidimicrobiia bacterium]
MGSYEGAVETGRPVAEVFNYIADFRNAAEWDPATVSISQTAGDGAGLGARYRLVTKFLASSVPLDYETTGFTPPNRLVLSFEGGNVAGTDTITVSSTGDRSRLTYHVDFRLKKGRLLEPLVGPFFRRTANRALAGLARALGGRVVTG